MTSVTTFGDVLGPRGRRRTRVASVLAVLLLLLLVGVAVQRFADQGQLDGDAPLQTAVALLPVR